MFVVDVNMAWWMAWHVTELFSVSKACRTSCCLMSDPLTPHLWRFLPPFDCSKFGFPSIEISCLGREVNKHIISSNASHINKSWKSPRRLLSKHEQIHTQCVPHPDIAMALYFTCITRNCSFNVEMYSRKTNLNPFRKSAFCVFLSNFLLFFRLFMNVKKTLSLGFSCIAVFKCNCSARRAVVCVLYSCVYTRGSRFFLLFPLENAIFYCMSTTKIPKDQWQVA